MRLMDCSQSCDCPRFAGGVISCILPLTVVICHRRYEAAVVAARSICTLGI